MNRKSHVGRVNNEVMTDRAENGRRRLATRVNIRQALRTSSWTAEVQALESAIGRFTADRPLTNECGVVFFEIARDAQLHVNVTHRHRTRRVRGWAGPANLPEGFVHNRRFGHAPASRIARHIHEMLFAARI